MLHLPDVTLVMVETRRHDIARLVALDAMRKVEFADVLLLSDRNLMVPGAKFHKIDDAPDKIGWERQFWYEVPRHVRTSHMLFIEWDAGIWDASCWSDEFLSYDYIGAPWYWFLYHQVGNGGFSLRSKRLIDYLVRNAYWLPCKEPGDNILCRWYRPSLELMGFEWAPPRLAMQFSLEHTRESMDSRHFGFHRTFNWNECLDEDEKDRRRGFI